MWFIMCEGTVAQTLPDNALEVVILDHFKISLSVGSVWAKKGKASWFWKVVSHTPHYAVIQDETDLTCNHKDKGHKLLW